jgi:hypothetical protein
MVTVLHPMSVHAITIIYGTELIAKFLSVMYHVYMVTVLHLKLVHAIILLNGMERIATFLFVIHHA